MNAASPKAPPLWILIAATALGPASLHILTPLLPGLVAAMDAGFVTVQLTLTAFFLALAVAQLVYGPLSDRFGRRPILVAGLGAYIAGTAICAAAGSIETLIAGRFIQGFGGCSGMVIGRAVVRDVHGREQSASVIAYITMAMVLAPAFSPALGAYVEAWLGWRMNFVLLGVVSVGILICVLVALPETNRAAVSLNAHSILSGQTELLRSRAFLGYSISTACSTASWYAFTAGAPYLLVEVLGRAPTAYGGYILIVMLGYMAGNFAAGRFSVHCGTNRMMLTGIFIALIAMAMLFGAAALFPFTPLSLFIPMAVSTFGNGVSQPNGIAGAISVRPELAGTASGLLGFIQMSTSAAATVLIGITTSGTQYPMIIVVTGFTIMAALGALLAVATRTGSPGSST